jgi:hypothetical protein
MLAQSALISAKIGPTRSMGVDLRIPQIAVNRGIRTSQKLMELPISRACTQLQLTTACAPIILHPIRLIKSRSNN